MSNRLFLFPFFHLLQQKVFENENIQRSKTPKRKKGKQSRDMITSVSEMSISNVPKKRQCVVTTTNIEEEQQTKTSQSIFDYKPKYLQVPDQVFKQMLSKSLTGADDLIQSLDTSEKMQYVRTYAHLLNNIFYWKLEQNYWENYYNVCTTEFIWSSPLTNDIIKENNLVRFKFKTKVQVDRHQKLIVSRLQESEDKLNQHKQKSINGSVDMSKLASIIPAFVRQGQHKLTAAFERKKAILQLDANDHRLVKTFYDMEPTRDQVKIMIRPI